MNNIDDLNKMITPSLMEIYVDKYINAANKDQKDSILDVVKDQFKINSEKEKLELGSVFSQLDNFNDMIKSGEEFKETTLAQLQDTLSSINNAIDRENATEEKQDLKILIIKREGHLVIEKMLQTMIKEEPKNYKHYNSHGNRLKSALNEPYKLLGEYLELSSRPSFKKVSKKLKSTFKEELKLLQNKFDERSKNSNKLKDVIEGQHNLIKEFDEALPDFNDIAMTPADKIVTLANVVSKIRALVGTQAYIERIQEHSVSQQDILIKFLNEGEKVTDATTDEKEFIRVILQLGSKLQTCLDITNQFLDEIKKQQSKKGLFINKKITSDHQDEVLTAEMQDAIEGLEHNIAEIKPKKKKHFFAKLISIIKRIFGSGKKDNVNEISSTPKSVDLTHCNETSESDGKNKLYTVEDVSKMIENDEILEASKIDEKNEQVKKLLNNGKKEILVRF